MADGSKRFVLGSAVVAAMVGGMALLDLVARMPFGRTHTMIMDIIFLVCAAILGYLCWDAYKDLQ